MTSQLLSTTVVGEVSQENDESKEPLRKEIAVQESKSSLPGPMIAVVKMAKYILEKPYQKCLDHFLLVSGNRSYFTIREHLDSLFQIITVDIVSVNMF